jgi:hypothetical protein
MAPSIAPTGAGLPALPAVPAPKFMPLPSAPEGVTAAFVDMSRVRVKYEVTKAGPSGVGGVELWLKDKNGWARASSVKDGEQLDVELPVDGAYGFKVVPVSGQGVRGSEPGKDTAPDMWIVRDMVKPVITLKVTPTVNPTAKKDAKAPVESVVPWTTDKAKDVNPPAPFVVEVTIRETNLDCQKTNFVWRDANAGEKNAGTNPLFTGADLSKAKIETKIGVFYHQKTTGTDEPGVFKAHFDWWPTQDVPAKLALSVEAIDRAGNKSSVTTEFGTDLTEPAAKVTGVQVVPMK